MLLAIVGAGIGGTAAAYYLRQEFGPAVKIDVFEAGTVGGRLATENIQGQDYETGGSIIHPLNLHMKHFVDRLGEFSLPFISITLIHTLLCSYGGHHKETFSTKGEKTTVKDFYSNALQKHEGHFQSRDSIAK